MNPYKVNLQCSRCGRRFSYMSDDTPEARLCPNTGNHEGERPGRATKLRRGTERFRGAF